jgi:hypothetical protein
MKNPLKRDVFRCGHPSHRRFGGKVSAFHVIREKACFPDGCLVFLWRCEIKEKGGRCVRGFEHTGKLCRGCTHYGEEKLHFQPRSVLTPKEETAFREDLETYEAWLDGVRGKRFSVAGEIKTIKPWLEKTVGAETHWRIRGHLLILKDGFIGLDRFEDAVFVRVPDSMMRIHGFASGMFVEMSGEIGEDRGRLIVNHPRSVELSGTGSGHPPERNAMAVAAKLSTRMDDQPDRCLECRYGLLVDIEDGRKSVVKRRRELYCIQGAAESENCYIKGWDDNKKKSPETN